ncbi:hypothetical protein HHK36_028445 [Tetracentron sinense]|uniref:4-coumarate--CoA ligase n=1 Tax=Tetracentron sinense TaxID=13715 RepID=A0A835D3G9_TETSI|nr:hypothetical protein HHK36_028445 [Tetracentron sinense]
MADRVEEKHCCISHEFFRAASTNPSKIAVIHASGGARICRQLRNKINDPDFAYDDEDKFFRNLGESSSPPVYEGDECFTFSDVLAAVNSLSSILRRILDGGDDPNLIRPRDPSWPKDRILSFLSSAKVGLIIKCRSSFDTSNRHQLDKSHWLVDRSSCSILCVSMKGNLKEHFGQSPLVWPCESRNLRSFCYLMYTSGSTGKPKGVCGTEQGLLNRFSWMQELFPLHGVELLLFKTSISFIDHLQEFLSAILTCTPLIIPPFEELKANPFYVVDFIKVALSGSPPLATTEAHLGEGFEQECGSLMDLVVACADPRVVRSYPLPSGLGSDGAAAQGRGKQNPLHRDIGNFKGMDRSSRAKEVEQSQAATAHSQRKRSDFPGVKAYSITRLTVVPSLIRAILPAMQSPYNMRVQRSLQVLVLSGEIFPLYLWDVLCKLLPKTSILNLYGSTEVSGDCTYFNCKKLPMILETQALDSVPIGVPISNCDVVLVGEPDAPNEGEIYVGGVCISTGCVLDPTIGSLDYVKLPQDSVCNFPTRLYFRTGDFARRLQSGDLVFLGRKDRTIKVNGQRISLDEIENILREHPDVVDAAVISRNGQGEPARFGAVLVLKRKDEFGDVLRFSIRSWLVRKLPLAMIPNLYSCVDSLPMSSTGKIDYTLLSGSTFFTEHVQNETDCGESNHVLLQNIKEAFCDALMVEKVMDDDDFFLMGGNSIAAAHVAHKLRINMRLLYVFPSPSMLHNALLDREGSYKDDVTIDGNSEVEPKAHKGNALHSFDSRNPDLYRSKRQRPLRNLYEKRDDSPMFKSLNACSKLYTNSKGVLSEDGYSWISKFKLSTICSFSRGNRVTCGGEYEVNDLCQASWLVEIPRNRKWYLQELWRVHLESCVDASPLVVFKDRDIYLFIGSHSHKFLCVNAIR